MEVIILAGGLGSRLSGVVNNVPKPMAPVDGVPFLEYIFEYLGRYSVDKVILSVGYKWEDIYEYFGDSFKNLNIVYSVESTPLGTGGAIMSAMNYSSEECVFIVNGDTYFDINLDKLNHAMNGSSEIVIALKKMTDFDRYGCIEIDGNDIVTAFSEKEYRKFGYINGGIYLVRSDIFEKTNLPSKFSFEEFMIKNLQDIEINSVVFNDYFIDIGVPEDYRIAQRELKNLI
jgi:D-glycero-alpha-D-manno-heptose 1-phosphate guanylyltransferase